MSGHTLEENLLKVIDLLSESRDVLGQVVKELRSENLRLSEENDRLKANCAKCVYDSPFGCSRDRDEQKGGAS